MITANAPSNQPWVVPQDLEIVGASFAAGPVGNCNSIISKNPSLTIADLIGSQHIVDDLIAMFSADYTSPLGFIPLSWQARKGETIYFSADGVGYLAVYYQLAETQ